MEIQARGRAPRNAAVSAAGCGKVLACPYYECWIFWNFYLEFERAYRHLHPAVITVPVNIGVIHEELHLVAVRIAQIEALADRVVG